MPLTCDLVEHGIVATTFLPKEGGELEFWILGNDYDPTAKVRFVGTLDGVELLRAAQSRPVPKDGTAHVRVVTSESIDDLVAGKGEITIELVQD